jgi:hypothetical protein
MAKVIVERPRHKERTPRRRWREAIEDAPSRLGMHHAAKTSGTVKYFSDHLSPLMRCIDKHVGRSWNKVFSELTADLKLDSPVQYHVRLHIDELVKTGLGPDASVKYLWRKAFYVDERGILRRVRDLAEIRAAKPAAGPKQTVRIGAREFKRKNGLWFELTGDDQGQDRVRNASDHWAPEQAWEAHQKRAEPPMRQLSRRELRQLGLSNEAA